MIVIDLKQNTPEWLLWRSRVGTASDCSTMLGINPWKTRKKLLLQKARERLQADPKDILDIQVSVETQALFDKGYEAEDLARPIIANICGQTLKNLCGTHDIHTNIAASFDGITEDFKTIFEHKLYSNSNNSKKRFQLALCNQVSPQDMAQIQQQLLVSQAQKCLFVVSDGTKQNMAIATIIPDYEMHKKIIQGWLQFEKEVQEVMNYI